MKDRHGYHSAPAEEVFGLTPPAGTPRKEKVKNKRVVNCLWCVTIVSVIVLSVFRSTPGQAVEMGSLPVTSDGGQPIEIKIVRDFVLYNYARLADDIINDDGIYLDTLYGLLRVPENQKAPLRSKLIKTLLEKKRIPEFSNFVAKYENCD